VKAGSVQRGDAHTIRVNEDEIGKAKAEYRVKRPRRIDGQRGRRRGFWHQARMAPKQPTRQVTWRTILRQAWLTSFHPKKGGGDHEERPAPKCEQRIGPPTQTEVASVSREHARAMARAATPDMSNTIMLSMEQHVEAADQTEAPRVAAANVSELRTDMASWWQHAYGTTGGSPPAQVEPRVDQLLPD
jgi:hypothetical protein